MVACTSQPVQTTPAITVVFKTDVPSDATGIDASYPITDGTLTPYGTVYPAGEEPTDISGSSPTTGPTSVAQGIPETDSETASVYGVLYSYTDQLPLAGVMIYAADVVVVETSGDKIYTTQEKSSPQDGTDDRGQFTITNITPGNYMFMMVTPFGNYPIFDKDNQTFELELKAGDVIDFEQTFVNWP